MSKPHDPEQLSKSNDSDRGAVASVWPYPRAPHYRDRRRLRLREGWKVAGDGIARWWYPKGKSYAEGAMPVSLNLKTAWYVAYHADESFTQHATLLEAHDALVESGSPSPFEVVTGAAVEPEHEPTPDAA
jgi:hypothetical protein